jgi:hypothetical protein
MVSGDADRDDLARIRRELDQALVALATPGAGAVGNLECRVADLQGRLLATPAATLADVETKLLAIRDIVAGLGPAGYLLHLVDATLTDVRALAARDQA